MKIRSAAALASAGLIAFALPAVAIAAPLTGSLDSLSADPVADAPDTNGTLSGDASSGCTVDWTSIGFHTFSGSDDTNEPTLVTPSYGSPGYLRTDSWGTQAGMSWRSVAATDEVIKDFSLQITLPAGFTYEKSGVSIMPADSGWFANSMQTTQWETGLGPDDLSVSDPVGNDDGTTTFTITADDGALPADSHFVISYTGTGTGTSGADTVSATQHLTGTTDPKPGDIAFCSSDIGGVISGSLGSLGLGSLSAS